MINKRVIARLDVKNNSLVKGIHLEGLRVLGNPEDFAQKYYEDGVDEIIYMDVVASLYGRNSLTELVKKTAKNIFVPLTVGGGIRNLDDVGLLLKSGADRISINTAAVKDPQLITKIANRYGSSTLVVAIETIKTEGKYKVFVDNGREYTGLDIEDWIEKIEDLGAGELLITSVDREGTGSGLDYELIDIIISKVNMPFIIHGGIGSCDNFIDAFSKDGINAICASSVFHYQALTELRDKGTDIKLEGNKDFLLSGRVNSKIKGTTINNLKSQLKSNNIKARYDNE